MVNGELMVNKGELKCEEVPLTDIEKLVEISPQELVQTIKNKSKAKKPKVKKEKSKLDRATKADIDRLVSACLAQGITVRQHNHPKTKEKWADSIMKVTVVKGKSEK